MWDDVTIGEGSPSNSAVCLETHSPTHSISENKTSYWISVDAARKGSFLDYGMMIFKNTLEGIQLKQLLADLNAETDLEDGAVVIAIEEALDQWFLKYADAVMIKRKILQATQRNYVNGSNDRAREVRNSLAERFE